MDYQILDAVEKPNFWKHIDMSGECWLWTRAKNFGGYGRFKVNGRLHASHRAVYEFIKGPIPEGMNLLHSCDTPACVNPDHLSLGTQRDNIADAVRKGRHRLPPKNALTPTNHKG